MLFVSDVESACLVIITKTVNPCFGSLFLNSTHSNSTHAYISECFHKQAHACFQRFLIHTQTHIQTHIHTHLHPDTHRSKMFSILLNTHTHTHTHTATATKVLFTLTWTLTKTPATASGLLVPPLRYRV